MSAPNIGSAEFWAEIQRNQTAIGHCIYCDTDVQAETLMRDVRGQPYTAARCSNQQCEGAQHLYLMPR